MLRKVRQKGINKLVLILGAGMLDKTFSKKQKNYPEIGYDVIGFLEDQAEWSAEELRRCKPILGRLNEL